MPVYFYGPNLMLTRKLIASGMLAVTNPLGDPLPVRLSVHPTCEPAWASELRIQIADSVPVLTHDEWATQTEQTALSMLELQRMAAKMKFDLETWRYCLRPIPASEWVAVEERTAGGEWIYYVPPDETKLPQAVQNLGRVVETILNPDLHRAYEDLFKLVSRADGETETALGSLAETIGDLSLNFAAMGHDLQSTRSERDAALQQALEQSFTFEEQQAVARLRAGSRDVSDLMTLLPRYLAMLGISW